MKLTSKAFLVLMGSLGLAACGSDSDTIEFSNVQAVHASADAPLANVWINDKATLTGVDYGVGSGYMMVREGSNAVQVDVQLPGSEVATVVPRTLLDLDSDLKYTVFVVGDADGNQNPVEPLIVTRNEESMADESSLDVQVVHAASGVPAVDVYVTDPGADLSTVMPLTNLAYKAATDTLNIQAGDYQVRLAVGDEVVFDSGTLSLAGNANLTIAAIKTGDSSSSSPVKLLVLDGSGSSIIQDMGSQAEVRVGHVVDGAPAVDVNVNDAPFAPLADLAFKEIRGYLDLDPQSYDIDVFVDGTTTDPIFSIDDLSVEAGMDYSIYAVGVVSPSVAVEPLIVEDMRRAVATSATLNITHAAANPVAENVDIYLTTSAGIDGSDPTVSDFTYKESLKGLYV